MAVMIPAMNVTRQYQSIKGEIDSVTLNILRNGQYILGEAVEDFECAFARYCGVKYAIGVGNGSDALVIALKACGVKAGDEVITTDMSFIATAEAIVAVGAKPVFADCSKDTYTIDPDDIRRKITAKTRAVIPVHLYGQCADMDEISCIAREHSLKVIEDMAQAAGATYKGRKAGSMGDAGCVSFFPTKNLGCAGDGGMVVMDSESIYRQCKAMRMHGSGLDGAYTYGIWNEVEILESSIDFNGNLPKYFNFIEGCNSRLDALQAGILSVKLSHLDDWNARRREIAGMYDEGITNPAIRKPIIAGYNTPVYYVYTIATEKRDMLKKYLEDNGIKSGIYFPVPLHEQKVFDKFEYKHGDFPISEYVAEHTLVLPMFPELEQKEIETIINVINQWKCESVT